MNLNPIHCAQVRAHLAGAESLILEREADALANAAGPPPLSIEHATPNQLKALQLATRAHNARRRYFRELEAIDLLLGRSPSPFGPLG